jgi:immune inhibitor A
VSSVKSEGDFVMNMFLRFSGVALQLLVLACLPVFSAAAPSAMAPNPMPLDPDVIERAIAGGQTIPFAQTEASFIAQGERRINVPSQLHAPLAQTVRSLVILVKFVDNPPGGPVTRYSPAVFDSLLFGRTYIRGGADPTTNRTLKNYYSEVSYGTVDIITLNMPGSVGWVTAPLNYAYYCQADGVHDYGFGPWPRNAQGLVYDAVMAADPYVDFSQYAVGGVVQNLFVVHSGSGAEWNSDGNLIWSHQWSYGGLYVDGVEIDEYSMEPECGGNTTGVGGAVTGPWLPTVGVYAHEFGHVLGLPDEYDYGYESQGTGRVSLMAGGSWNRSPNVVECNGNSPAHLSAWGRARLGFVTPIEVPGNLPGVSIPPIEVTNVGSLYKLTNPSSFGKEYWLVENRQQTGFDEGFLRMTADAHGIVIYHVDENVLERTFWRPNEAECVSVGVYMGTNNCDCATLPENSSNAEKWYGISVEQADGLYQLELGLSSGFWQDFYGSVTGKTAFTAATNPNPTSYYGCSTSIAVSGISGSVGTMTADLWGPNPIAVYLAQFRAERRDQQVLVHWAISQARDNAGFYIWRQDPGSDRVRLSQTLLSGTDFYDFIDPAPPTGQAEYWLQEMTADGSENWYGPARLAAATIPTALRLAQNHPNPFNPRTSFSFGLPHPGRLMLAIYDVRGTRVATLVDTDLPAGEQSVEWTGLGDDGTPMPSGVYFARLETAAGVRTVKVTLAK